MFFATVMMVATRRALVDIGAEGVVVSLRDSANVLCNVARKSDEPVGKAMARLERSMSKKLAKPVRLRCLDASGMEVSSSMENCAGWRQATHIEVDDGNTFKVVMNPARMLGLDCYGSPIVGSPMVVRFSVTQEARVDFTWFDTEGPVGSGSRYTPSRPTKALRVEACLVNPDPGLTRDERCRSLELGAVIQLCMPKAWRRSTDIGASQYCRIATYNALADVYARRTPGCPPTALRAPIILGEILRLDPDILCMQEIDQALFYKFWKPQLDIVGYHADFAPKGGDSREGLATFVKQDRFDPPTRRIVAPLPGEFNTIALVHVLAHKFDSSNTLAVANTHFYFANKATALRARQMHSLLKRLSQLQTDACVLAGDLNAFPHSAALALALQGQVSAQHRDLVDEDTDPSYSFHNGAVAAQQQGAGVIQSPASFRLASAYSLESPSPTHHVAGFTATLDYILYDSQRFRLQSTLPLPDIVPGVSPPLPTLDFPSDHYLLAADLTPRTNDASPR